MLWGDGESNLESGKKKGQRPILARRRRLSPSRGIVISAELSGRIGKAGSERDTLRSLSFPLIHTRALDIFCYTLTLLISLF